MIVMDSMQLTSCKIIRNLNIQPWNHTHINVGIKLSKDNINQKGNCPYDSARKPATNSSFPGPVDGMASAACCQTSNHQHDDGQSCNDTAQDNEQQPNDPNPMYEIIQQWIKQWKFKTTQQVV